MSCYSELVYSMFADCELGGEEARQIQMHLATCGRCRVLTEALRVENLLLRDALQDVLEPSTQAAHLAVVRGIAWVLLGGLVVALGLQTSVRCISGLFPAGTEWLNPFRLDVLWTVHFSIASFLLQEGAAMFTSLLDLFALFIVGLLVAGVARVLAGRRPRVITFVAGLAAVFCISAPSFAVERRSGVTVTLPSGQTVDDTLLAAGDMVNIEGVVNGNLVAFAERVTVRGNVKGDVIAFGRGLDLDGTVEGNVYAWAQIATMRGCVVRDLLVMSQNLDLHPESQVGNDIIFAGRSVELRGSVGRHFRAYAGSVIVSSQARVGGNLDAYVRDKQRAVIEPGAVAAGHAEIHLPRPEPSRYLRARFYFWQLVRLGAALLTGLLLYWLLPIVFEAELESAHSVLRAVGVGFLVLVATPVGALIAGITLVGLPIALLAFAIWLAALYLAKVFVAAFLGRSFGRRGGGKPRPLALDLLLGLVFVFFIINLPYVGRWLSFLLILLGLGIAYTQLRRSRLVLLGG